MGLSGGEVASRAGLTEEQVKRFTELGIIRRREADGSYSEPDVLRARLALALFRGIREAIHAHFNGPDTWMRFPGSGARPTR